MAPQPPPNIILINCDDLGYGDLGCYGSPVNPTPNLDRLAAEGTRFTDFYVASPVCSPSRGALMTGCYPPRIGFDVFDRGHAVLFPGESVGLSNRETTLASLLKTRGYATQIVGKWHCGDQPEFLPTRHGFDRYFGLPYSNDMSRMRERTQAPPLPLLRDEDVIEQQPDMAALTERYVAEAVGFMRERRDQPFFLYFAHMYVHLPLIVPEHFLSRSLNGRYGAAVLAIDWATGVLMRVLQELGIDDDTLVLFTSDNGSRAHGEGGSNGGLRGHKGQTWEGGMRVPLIARWPDRIPAGRVCRTLAGAIDLLPTLAAVSGSARPDRPIDGVDLSAVLRGGNDAPRDHFCYFNMSRLNAVRDERYKLFVCHGNQPEDETVCELYDLVEDPGESHNIAVQHPEVVARLGRVAEQMVNRLGPAGTDRREIGRVAEPRPLTTYDPRYPYFAAEYDLNDVG